MKDVKKLCSQIFFFMIFPIQTSGLETDLLGVLIIILPIGFEIGKTTERKSHWLWQMLKCFKTHHSIKLSILRSGFQCMAVILKKIIFGEEKLAPAIFNASVDRSIATTIFMPVCLHKKVGTITNSTSCIKQQLK